MLEFIEQRLGHKFPYESYSQIVAPRVGSKYNGHIHRYIEQYTHIIQGAMENITLTTWDAHFLLDQKRSDERQRVTDMINFHGE